MFQISRSTTWGRIYSYWENLTGGNRRGYQENLCHFVRVILFWTWWHAFWEQSLFGTFVRPWMIVIAGVYIEGFVSNPAVFAVYTIGALVIVAVIVFGVWVLGTIVEKLQENAAWTWFWNKKYSLLVYPWTVTILLGYVWSYFFAPVLFALLWSLASAIVRILLTIVVAVAILVGIVTLIDRFSPKRPVGSARSLSSTGVLVEYLKARKKKLCPLIKVTD